MDILTIYTESPGGCRKRRREFYNERMPQQQTNSAESKVGVTNPAFTSSTPNKSFVRSSIRRSRRQQTQSNGEENKENLQIEVKTVTEVSLTKEQVTFSQPTKVSLAKEQITLAQPVNHSEANTSDVNIPENPYEVIRKPPKKKKKSEIEESCFENPALNLDAPERTFNPFEVIRSPNIPNGSENHEETCFTNNGLDIRVQDVNVNPFEIARSKSPVIKTAINGIENPALEIRSPKQPTNIAIGLPFQPTMGCRIDFDKVPLETLIGSSNDATKSISKTTGSIQKLPIIEEDEEVDIGKELDCYQLELENSINEAKLKKAGIESVKKCKDFLKSKVALNEIENISGIAPLLEEKEENLKEATSPIEKKTAFEITVSQIATPKIKQHKRSIITKEKEEKELEESIESLNNDLSFDENIPAPFVRCYRKPEQINTSSNQNEVEKINEDSKKEVNEKDENKNKIGSVIRRSIRKLMIHPNKKNNDKSSQNSDLPEIKEEESDNIHKTHNLFQTIRQSLRRKPKSDLGTQNKNPEISIVDCSERTKVFRSPNAKVVQTKDTKSDKLKHIFSKHTKYNF